MANTSSRTLKKGEDETAAMRPAALALALVLLTAGLAGCLGDEDADATPTGGDDPDDQSRPSDDANEETSEDAGDPDEDEEESGEDDNDTSEEASKATDEDPRVEIAWFNGSVRGQSAPVLGPFCVETCDNQFAFTVSENVTGLVAELTWEAEASLLFDIDVPYEECGAGIDEDCPPASTSGDGGYLSISVSNPSDIVAGNWTASAWAEDNPTQAVDFTIAVSLFEDEIPRDYGELVP